MPLHLLKLCVGADSIADLDGWIASRLAEQRRAGQPAEQRHTTRMVPKRAAELLDGGSLFWVIRGQVAARQRLLGACARSRAGATSTPPRRPPTSAAAIRSSSPCRRRCGASCGTWA